MTRKPAIINGKSTVAIRAMQHYGSGETIIKAKLWFTKDEKNIYAECTKSQVSEAKNRVGLPDGDYLDFYGPDCDNVNDIMIRQDSLVINYDGEVIGEVVHQLGY